MNRETLDKWLERGILGLVLAILVFAPLATGAVRPFEFLVVQALTVLIGVLWIFRLWIAPDTKIFWPPIAWAVLAFVLYAVARCSIADIEYVARQEMIRVVIYGFLFFAITNNVKRAEPAQIIAVTLIILASGIAVYAAFQFLTKSPNLWTFNRPVQYLSRGSGTFVNPNHLAGFLEMILPLTIAFTLLGRFKHVSKIFLGYAGLIILVGIGFSVSRGGWAATGIVLLGMLVILFKQRGSRLKAAIIFVLLMCIGLAFVNASWFERRVQQSYASGQFEDIRPWIWESAIDLWKEEPWLGGGPGHFDERYAKHRQADWRVQGRPQYVHNDYLNALAEWGIIGVIIILSSFLLLARGFFCTWAQVGKGQTDLNRKRSNREAILLGALFGVIAILLHSVVDFNLQIPANAILFVTLMALITSFRRYETRSFSDPAKWVTKMGLSVLLLVGIWYLSLQGVRRFEEQKWLKRAEQLAGNPDERIAALKKAYDAEPQNFNTTYRIGEMLRHQSWQGNADYKEKALEAMRWFHRGMRLNRHSPYNYLRYGMCMDWIGEHEKARAFFEKAVQVDPNGYFVASFMGWHYLQIEDYDNAKQWFDRSLELYNNYLNRNPMPGIYLEIINRRLTETSEEPVLDFPPQP
ncbi:MAG: O-antigen ligase family protein [Verrucomicrobia bacterium]|nr:O-antigen ligase family protein [Verrucomicrobiota bacterium]